MSVEEEIIEKIRALPAEKQEDLLRYVSELSGDERKPFRSPKGILADLDFDLTEEDIAEVRREMWGNPRRDDIA